MSQLNATQTNAATEEYISNPFYLLLKGCRKFLAFNDNYLTALLPTLGLVGLVMNTLTQTALSSIIYYNDGVVNGGLYFFGPNLLIIYPLLLIAFSVAIHVIVASLALSSSTDHTLSPDQLLTHAADRFLPALGLVALVIVGLILPLTLLNFPLFEAGNTNSLLQLSLEIICVLILSYGFVRFSYAFIAVIDGRGPIEALAYSWFLSRRHFVETLASICANLLPVAIPVVLFEALAANTVGLLSIAASTCAILASYLGIIIVVSGFVERYQQLKNAADTTRSRINMLNIVALLAFAAFIIFSSYLFTLGQSSVSSTQPGLRQSPDINQTPSGPDLPLY